MSFNCDKVQETSNPRPAEQKLNHIATVIYGTKRQGVILQRNNSTSLFNARLRGETFFNYIVAINIFVLESINCGIGRHKRDIETVMRAFVMYSNGNGII